MSAADLARELLDNGGRDEGIRALGYAVLALREPDEQPDPSAAVIEFLSRVDVDLLREAAMSRLTGMGADPVQAVLDTLLDEAHGRNG